jgi:hypothetical protein
MPTRIRSGRLATPPWLHLGPRLPAAFRPIDLNRASRAALRDALHLSAARVAKIVRARRTRPLRDVNDLATALRLTAGETTSLAARVYGTVRPEVILLDIAIERERIFSDRPWAVRVRFLPPTGGSVAIAALEVRWRGRPFVLQRRVTAAESRRGELRIVAGAEHVLPPGPVELLVSLYDSLGGASTQCREAWVLPSNPLTLFVSPANRSIYNGSVRPDWQPPDWVTGVTLTFVNGDAGAVALQRPMTWKFWDGGIGGTLVESGTFTWPETISVPAFGTYAGWMTFTSPPGSSIHDRYENREDMTIELIFQRQAGGSISGTVTCRIMAGWGVNIIEVGSYSGSEESTIAAGIADARDVYENHGLSFSSVDWWIISNADAGGYTVLADEDEWEDLVDDWTVPNDSVDCFVVRGFWNSYAGWSPFPGPDSKDSDDDGLAVDNGLGCFAHELGHYMGGHDHADALGAGNVMFSTCGGRNFTYDQYRDFLDHGWTRILR